MKKKFMLSLIMVAVLLMALTGGAFAAQETGKKPGATVTSEQAATTVTDEQTDVKWGKVATKVGLLKNAGVDGYDFKIVQGENLILLVPAGPGIAEKLSENLNCRVRVRGKLLAERFTHRSVMEVSAVRVLARSVSDEVYDDESVNENVYDSNDEFSDITPGHWASKAIREMARHRVIMGMGDKKFQPGALVTRAQFATMLVKALGLQLPEPTAQTFADVGPQDWSYKYVEAAKDYLTGFETQAGTVLFRPDLPAVREDMAAAIIKALDLEPATDLSVLDNFSDSDNISESLKPYVAAAVNEGLMKGYEDGTFRPQGKLTRAEAAALLYKVMLSQKIVM
ncbi:MAG: S-layer homology domain-containing protein [Peptococcaceae bacterium]|nr:S-layer homology domain-containing protein [Peptococcaceae bacterium]